MSGPTINEFVANHTGSDTAEFIEVFLPPGVPVPDGGLTVLVVEGDGTGAGVVDAVLPVGAFDAQGFWSTGFLANALENGTLSLLLATFNSATVGQDLDTNNDGVLDVFPWGSVLDSVAVSDGGADDRTYASVVLTGANIGAGFTPGGASRSTDPNQTGGAEDWLLNDFDGAGLPGFTGSVTGNEVASTPGTSNGAAALPTPGITVAPAGVAATEGGATGSFTVVLDTQPTANVTIAVSGDSQATPSLATLTFTPANWNLPQAVTVTATDDTASEGAHTALITLGAASSTDPAYGGRNVPDVTVAIADNDETLTAIGAIQGAGHRSALEGQVVITTGIVTARSNNGFWLQDATPDADLATSEGIFVFTGSAPAVTVGDAVQVTGTVTEFTRNTSDPGHLSVTQLTAPSIVVQSSGNALPDAVVIGTDRAPPTENTDDDGFTVFDAALDGVDFWESLEGMRVELPDAIAVSPSFNSTSTTNRAETFAVANQGAGATGLNAAGGLTLSETDANPERVAVQANQQVLPGADFVTRPGDKLGDVVGVLDYDSRGNFEIILTQAVTVTPGGLAKEGPTLLRGDAENLTVGTYNVENLAGTTAAAKFTALGLDIAQLMGAPDIIALQEIQDNNGTTNNGVVDASETYGKLIAAITAAGGPTYRFLNLDPENNTSGGAPGGNIRVGFLYNDDRVDVVAGSLRQVDPTNAAAWAFSRIPLAADFAFNNEVITVVNNHWASKGGSSPQFGTIQPLQNGSEDQRVLQAAAVKGFVDGLLASDAEANIVVMGDLNEFAWEDSLDIVTGRQAGNQVLFDLFELSEPDATERYEYVFDGNHQILDHLLASSALVDGGFAFDSLQVNSQFPSAQRNSDHDPAVARFTLAPAAPEAELGFALWRDAAAPGRNPAPADPLSLLRQQATELFLDNGSSTTLPRFLAGDGDVPISRIDFQGAPSLGSLGGAPVLTLDWLTPDSALLRLDAAWNTVKTAQVTDFTGQSLRLENWVDVLVQLEDATRDLTIIADGMKRGVIATGSGDDVVNTLMDANNLSFDNTVRVNLGAGDDIFLIDGASRDFVRSKGWVLSGVATEVTGGDGDDNLVGAASTDTAVFQGNRADYTIELLGGVTQVTALASDEGVDLIQNFEFLRFADATLALNGGIWA